MDLQRPMLAPMILAAGLLIVGAFLMQRMLPGGFMSALRGEGPKQTRTLTFVPALAANPGSDAVAWGEPGLLQIGLEAPPRHGTEGSIWMGLRLRHVAPAPVGLSVGAKGVAGSGKAFVKVLTATGQTVEWPVSEDVLAFSLEIPKGGDVTLPFKYQEPSYSGAARQTGTITVNLSIRDVAIRTEKGTVGPLDLETGGIVLTRCWSPDAPVTTKGHGAGDDVLGIRPGDIVIPVPSPVGR
jgi:hypothetical protein